MTMPARAVRTRGTRPRQSPHPTASLLLETAVELMDSLPIDGLSTSIVLERSGVSYGSLYHHYADISDLVEQAIVYRYTRRLKDSVESIRSLLEARDAADFRQRTEALILQSVSSDRRRNRLDRAEALGALQGRPRLVARLAAAQQEVTDAQAALLAEMQNRGWVRADVDPVALSGYVQAMTFCRIVDDVTERPVDDEQWCGVALLAFRAVLFPE